MKIYKPDFFTEGTRVPAVSSAWIGLERIIPSIIKRFNLNTHLAVEFGVWHGYSSAALANYFDRVIGVDPFTAALTSCPSPIYEKTKQTLAPWPNVALVESGYETFVWPDEYVDLVHIDSIHTYDHTMDCARVSLQHTKCIIAHDTEAFPEVKRVLNDLAKDGFEFYNYPECCGLGILVKEEKNV